MRFRISHLLMAAIIVAMWALALANASFATEVATGIVVWLIYASIACRAVLKPQERPVLCCALIFGVSLLWLSSYESWGIMMNTQEWTAYGAAPTDGMRLFCKVQISIYGASVLAALLAGAFAGYVLRSGPKA